VKAHPRYAATPLANLGAHLAFDIPKLTDDELSEVSWSFGRVLDALDEAAGETLRQSSLNLDKTVKED
jgi:hypothetical protein